jgi:hypothetical protein
MQNPGYTFLVVLAVCYVIAGLAEAIVMRKRQ